MILGHKLAVFAEIKLPGLGEDQLREPLVKLDCSTVNRDRGVGCVLW